MTTSIPKNKNKKHSGGTHNIHNSFNSSSVPHTTPSFPSSHPPSQSPTPSTPTPIQQELTLYTANLNGLKSNCDYLVKQVIQHNSLTALQELRAHDIHHVSNFKHHLDRYLGPKQYFLALNDHRQLLRRTDETSTGGVGLIIQPSFPGYDDLQHLQEFDIPDRYLLASTFWGNQPVYIHVLYAPASPYGQSTTPSKQRTTRRPLTEEEADNAPLRSPSQPIPKDPICRHLFTASATNPADPSLQRNLDQDEDEDDEEDAANPNQGGRHPYRGPNHKTQFFNSLPREFPDNAIHLVLGDFNLPLKPFFDSANPRDEHKRTREACYNWLSTLNVVDPWRLHNPEGRCYTGPRHGPFRKNKLDYIFINSSLNTQCYRSSKFHNLHDITDHLCHSVILSPTALTLGKGPWRCPKELLDEERIIASVKTEAKALLTKIRIANNPGVLWDGFMRRTKSIFQRIQHLQLLLKARAIKKIDQQVIRAFRHKDRNLNTQRVYAHCKEMQEQTHKAWQQYNNDRQFDAHRLRQEKSTQDFFRPPKTRLYKVPVTEALRSDNSVTKDPLEVQQIFVDHWEKIFQHDDTSKPNLYQRTRLLQFLDKRLTDTQRDSLDTPLEVEEFVGAIKAMAPNTSPGLDGFPGKFFKIAPNTFSEILQIVFNYQLQRGTMLGRHRKAAVVLLYKNGDRNDPSNYRPIALMSVELKILARVLAYRMSTLLGDIIHHLQKAFVKERRIHDHIHLLKSIQTHLTHQNEEGFSTFLDFTKAYDRVDWNYMFEALETANFGPIFLSWIKLLYRDPMVIILFNGMLSRPVYPSRGVKQGCPLSALLFVITIEPLSGLLRSRPELGISIDSVGTYPGALFADDVLLLSHSHQALTSQLDLVQIYCEGSGACLNRSKSKIVYLNNTSDIPALPPQDLILLPSGASQKYLGILFGHRLEDSHQLDILDARINKAILQWGFRGRTLMGRVLLVKSVILSILWHFTAVIAVPQKMIRHWQAMVRKYILCRRTKPEDPEYTLLSAAYQYDPLLGLSIPHISSSIRYQRLRHLQVLFHSHKDPTQPWAALVWWQFNSTLGDFHRPDSQDWLFFDKRQRTTVIDDSCLPAHWNDIWIHWSSIPWSNRLPNVPPVSLTLGQILGMPIWLSSWPWFLCKGPRTSNPLAVFLQYNRPWYQLLAAHGFYCLADFMPLHSWPSIEQFESILDDRLGVLPPTVKRPVTLIPLYTQLTRFIHNIEDLLQVSLSIDRLSLLLAPTIFSFFDNASATVIPFPDIPRATIKFIANHSPPPNRPHPMTTTQRQLPEQIEKALRLFKMLYPAVTPIYGNVWFQILLRTLPTNSRFSWHHRIDPIGIECSYPDCHFPETYEHVLFSCPTIAPIWAFHSQAWTPLGCSLSWDSILHPEFFQVLPQYRPQRKRLRRLWFSLTATILYTLWKARLATKNDDKSPPNLPFTINGILDLWAVSVRSWLRHTPEEKRPPILKTLKLLGSHSHYKQYWDSHPNMLSLKV